MATITGYTKAQSDTILAAKADLVSGVVPISQIPALPAKADLVNGVIPSAQIPAIALNNVVSVASRTAMLALTSSQVQPGDGAVDTSTGSTRGTYILTAADPSVIGNWILLNSPVDVVSSVNGQNGTVVLGATDVNAEPLGLSDTSKQLLTTFNSVPKATTTKSVSIITEINPNDSFTYNARIRPVQNRRSLRVINIGVNPFQVAYGIQPDNSGLNNPTTGWTTVPPGSEFVDTSGNNAAMFLRDSVLPGVGVIALVVAETFL